jgi:hypothetical protein
MSVMTILGGVVIGVALVIAIRRAIKERRG